MTQNCQTLVPDPMLAPRVCAERWICFFFTTTAMRLLRVLKSNAFLPPECAAASIRGQTVAHQVMSAKRKT
jgi:hypothetical protein